MKAQYVYFVENFSNTNYNVTIKCQLNQFKNVKPDENFLGRAEMTFESRVGQPPSYIGYMSKVVLSEAAGSGDINFNARPM